MTIGLFSTAISGIHAAQIGLQTTEHNINNQNTPGFNRQRNIQTTNLAMRTGAGFIGQGASVSTIERIYDGFLNGQINRAQTASSELGAYYDRIVEIDNMLPTPKRASPRHCRISLPACRKSRPIRRSCLPARPCFLLPRRWFHVIRDWNRASIRCMTALIAVWRPRSAPSMHMP